MTCNKFLQNRPKKRNPTQKQQTDSPFFLGFFCVAPCTYLPAFFLQQAFEMDFRQLLMKLLNSHLLRDEKHKKTP